MADYPISKEAVQKMLVDLRTSLNERYISIGISMALHKLEGFPQMDAVDVVRCRECKNYRRDVQTKLGFRWCYKWGNIVTDMDFCSYGVRKEE